MKHDEHPTNCSGCSYCSDTYGVDAIKDCNAEGGYGDDPYNPYGYYEALRRGYFTNKKPRKKQ